MNRFFAALVIFAIAAALAGCGRRSALDTPFTAEEAMPGTPQDQAARNPPRDKDGRPIQPETKPGPTPAMRSFPLDPLLQ
jgi:predicted small lipoprotein YifL